MSVAIVTGSGGLIGSESARLFHEKGLHVVGIDNDMRRYFFGAEASTAWSVQSLEKELNNYSHEGIDIRDDVEVERVFQQYGKSISVVVHTAAQPSHDWAAREPVTDFTINANGTLVLLEAVRKHCPDSVFIFVSTNKVYGDTPNRLPLLEQQTRWEIDPAHPFAEHGIDESMSIDQSKHSLFGASKAAADLLVQEYGRYFGIKSAIFRGGCLTGPAHSGAELHGFLAYLVKCVLVRDNIHSHDLVSAFWHFFEKPRVAAVYNIGGSRHSNCSMQEAIADAEQLCDRELNYSLSDEARSGDHIWWISDVRKFQNHYSSWNYAYDHKKIIGEIVDVLRQRSQP